MKFSEFLRERGKDWPAKPGFKEPADRIGRCANDVAKAWGQTIDKALEEYLSAIGDSREEDEAPKDGGEQ